MAERYARMPSHPFSRSATARMYGRDLAFVHHFGFGDFARRASPGLLALLRANGIRHGLVVDLGCGSGLWLREAARAGFETLGIDRSASFIALARREAPSATLRVGSIYHMAIPACDAVTAMGEVLSYCPGATRHPPSLLRLFRRVATALRPGGLFLFDVLIRSPGPLLQYRTWRQHRHWAVLIDSAEDQRRTRVTRRISTFRQVGKTYRRTDERHVLRVATREEIERTLRATGFTVRAVRQYGAFELPPRRLAFRARKRTRGPAK